MKRLMVLVLAMFILFTGETHALTLKDSLHYAGTVQQEVYVYNGYDYDYVEKPVYYFDMNFGDRELRNQLATINPNYEADSPLLGVPDDKNIYYDENGEKFKIRHPKVRKDTDRSKMQYNIKHNFDQLTERLYSYNKAEHKMDVPEYIRTIFDKTVNNVVEYHVYTELEQVKVYFSDCSYLTIVYSDKGIGYCEYNTIMLYDDFTNYSRYLANNTVMKNKEIVYETDTALIISYINGNGRNNMLNVTTDSYGSNPVMNITLTNNNQSLDVMG